MEATQTYNGPARIWTRRGYSRYKGPETGARAFKRLSGGAGAWIAKATVLDRSQSGRMKSLKIPS